jgi:class I lanthipeptide synthase
VNVVARPVLRDAELVCLGGSGAPPERRLSLDDLLVAVEDGRVVLRSRRLGRRVVPRLTCAHNVEWRGMSVYRFLCALQTQGPPRALGFWGPLEAAPFLPRVRHGRVVLARARWRLEAAALDDLDRWRHEHGVPRFVALVDFGGQQPVDLDNALAVDSLAQAVRSRGAVDVVELFPPADELCVTGPEGSFAHELVVPFVRTAPAPSRPAARQLVRVDPARARFAPGSEWLYVRLYTGETVADAVLTTHVSALVGGAERWFFLRYRDPDFHLRVRLGGEPAALRSVALPEDELVWRVEVGTYQRELDRYGGPEAIDAVEDVFHADSDAVLAVLPLLEAGDEGQRERWQLGLAGVHRLLVDLGLDDRERLELVRAQRDGIARRLGWSAQPLARVGERFRKERADLVDLLGDDVEGHPLAPGLAILRERSVRLAPARERLLELEGAGRLTLPRLAIAGSLVHMHLNRLLRGDNAAQELVICDFLGRLYEAAARRRRAAAP